MRRLALIFGVLAVAAGGWVAAGASAGDSHTYKVELDNAFGLVSGSDVRVAGVIAGSVKGLDVNEAKRAVITVEISGPFSDFRSDATCSSEPQSLIAEYFLDCQPGHAATKSNGFIPVKNTTTTVPNDLVTNILREPFKQKFQLLINEFGTALAGNPKNLNEAIRRGAPALRDLRGALDILGKQNKIIRDLNANSDLIIGKLTENRENVIRFVHNARQTAEISATRRAALQRNFHLLPQFLAELQPTLKQLGKVAHEQTPLLTDLRASAPQLNLLADRLPRFNDATKPALLTLGDAAAVGKTAFSKSNEEIAALTAVAPGLKPVFKQLGLFLNSLDNPGRFVEEDTRATDDNCRSTPANELPAQVTDVNHPSAQTSAPPSAPPQCNDRQQPAGYSGLEGLLNYVYYQTTAINQFDAIGHMLHFTLYEVATSPCFAYNGGGKNGPGVPTSDGAALKPDLSNLHRCVAWLGDNQPDVCKQANNVGNCSAADALTPYGPGSGGNTIGPYGGSACPTGTDNPVICQGSNPDPLSRSRTTSKRSSAGGTAGAGGAQGAPDISKALGGLLGLPQNALKGLTGGNGKQGRALGLRKNGSSGSSSSSGGSSTAIDLLQFLFG